MTLSAFSFRTKRQLTVHPGDTHSDNGEEDEHVDHGVISERSEITCDGERDPSYQRKQCDTYATYRGIKKTKAHVAAA